MGLRKVSLFLFVCFCIIVSVPSMVLSSLSPASRTEIRYLLSRIEQSGCLFCRNDVWYQDTRAVREHVERKYDYFAKKGKINSTEDFIKWAGTKSEMSGRTYMVKCGETAAMPLSQWLDDELIRYRKERHGKAGQDPASPE